MELEKEVTAPNENPSLLGMFMSPGQQFERIRENPKIWVSLFIASIFYVLGSIFMALSINESDLCRLTVLCVMASSLRWCVVFHGYWRGVWTPSGQ